MGIQTQYRNTLETKLIEIQKLSCSRETDEITAHGAIDAYMDRSKLNCTMRDSAVEAGCNSKQHNQKVIGAMNLSGRYTVRCNRADIAVGVSSYNDIEPRALHGLTHAACHSD